MACSRKVSIERFFGILCLSTLAWASPAHAWYKHHALMPLVLAGKPFEDSRTLTMLVPPSCGIDYTSMMVQLVRALELNPMIERFPSPFESACLERRPMTGKEILIGPSIDDPDESGMDENLPDATDPNGDRRWLGGMKGHSSKGFRHFYLAGWTLREPIASFQVPDRPLGLAPERAALIGARARAAWHSGNLAWGYRLLAWTMHYLQDLTQPFHASQDLSLTLVPWSALLDFHTPDRFLGEIERSVTNYHWALEGYVLERTKATVEDSPWQECLSNPAAFWTIPSDIAGSTPRAGDEEGKALQLAHVARGLASASRDLAGELGGRLPAFFGRDLMAEGASMPKGTVQLDYAALSIRPDLERPRALLHQTICKALANTAWATAWLLQWIEAP